ncbi:MAG: NAD(P)/FAD-dependent oxidoreductase [Acidobacteria bacterium]|nr:NAD(P)/FAD-dependent oxidoreductase [Acidobacteriota bacterium]
MNKIATDILIIGGGPAGMAAALSVAENSDAKILIVDDNPYLGGQIWRSELGKIKSPEAKKLIEKLQRNKIEILCGTQIFGKAEENCLLAENENGSAGLRFKKLIIATGARERFLPFPGWTLPNVFGAAGLQALVKSGYSVNEKRIVIAGTGPLLLAVAEYLVSKGGNVLMILEQADRAKLARFGLELIRSPKKLADAFALRRKIKGVSYLPNSYVESAEGNGRLESINICRGKNVQRVECDILAVGFHLLPNTEIAEMIGCSIKNGLVKVDNFQKTKVRDVFCVGEPTGIGGVDLSLIEGKIGGLASIEEYEKAETLFKQQRRNRRFADAMNRAFALRGELKELPSESTLVCRC